MKRRGFGLSRILIGISFLFLWSQAAFAVASITDSQDAGSTSPVTSVVTLTQATGDFVQLWGYTDTDAATLTIADTKTQTWSNCFSKTSSAFANAFQCWYAFNVTSGSNVITLTTTSAGSVHHLYAVSVAGGLTTDPFDKSASANTSFTGGTDSWSSGNTATLSQAAEFVTSIVINVVDQTPPYWTAGTGYTKLAEDAVSESATEWKQVASTAAVAGTWTPGGASNGGSVGVVTFKLSSGGGPTCHGGLLLLGAGGC